ncbi:DUF6519 domain-containing protein [Nonomuraea sp. B1E8]|uniref:DUF6519 domain-containing protein n=1 Tax=unclassified Nonomuraea TaxID=2593643 RepID=UPI00325F4921
MQGDFTRWTFDPRKGYRSVLLQQGRVLLDAEWNEQTQITAQHDEVRTRDVVGQAGGPLDGAGFDLVDASGAVPKDTAWADLRITPGRYYVDGVLVEAAPPADGGVGHELADQPYLRRVGDLPGLPEPPGNGGYAVLLDCFNQHVTADQVPRLLDSALGSTDTTTRARTVWQVRLVKVAAGTTCADVADPLWRDRKPPTMTADLPEPDATADPCRLSTSGGYRRLENQLYRIQVHDVGTDGIARYLYSRENGSVVAGLTAIGPSSAAGMDADLTLSRIGRDEELSFHQGDLVEVTSPDRELHSLPGHLATAGAPDGLALPVKWASTAPADLAALGSTPIVRRWDGPAQPADSSPDELDKAGIQVRFGAGDFRTGDHWLIPARTVRLMYGISALSGTIEWPEDENKKPIALPPLGPEHHVAVLGMLQRSTAGGKGRWTRVESCRRLTPPLTELVTIDLLGGDGQQASAGQPLPEPVRVVVRNGGVPVQGARVKFSATGGNVATGVPTTTDPAENVFQTDKQGQADVRWRLPATGPATHVLTAVRLDDAGHAVGAEVRVTGRRQEEAGGSVCLVVRPETDLVQLFAGLYGVAALDLCLTSGTWELTEPAVLSGVGCVRISGAGAVATKISSTAGAALRFVNCGEVQVRDLSVAAQATEHDERLGALTVQCSGPALVERVHAAITDAPVAMAAGITIRGGYWPVSRTAIRDCRVRVGHAQTGVLVIDSERTDVTGCDISATSDNVNDSWGRFLKWLRDPRFARLVARRAVHPLRAQEDDPLGLRKGYSVVNGFPPGFATEVANDDEGWSDYLYGAEFSTVEELQTFVRDDLMRPDVLNRFFPSFITWLGGVHHDLSVLSVSGAGITVAGSTAGEVRVRDNVVTGALAGITVALRHRDSSPRTVQHAWISGNTINPPWRAPTTFIHQAISIGHCRRLDITSNVVDFAGNTPNYPMQGLRCAGRLGPHAVVAGNMFLGTTNGIRVETGPADVAPPILRVARDNICTSGPALVESAGLWMASDNVSG